MLDPRRVREEPPAPPRGWRERWQAWRDRLLADERFRRWAGNFAPTRPIARARAAELFDLVAGFVYSQVLSAAVRLDLFERLAEGPRSAAQLAPLLDLSPEAARRLLEACVSLDLAEWRGGPAEPRRYGLGPLGAAMVGNRAIASMVEHHAALYRDLADPVALLRGAGDGAMRGYWPYAAHETPALIGAERVAAYSALMAASQPLVADQILDAYPVARHRCLLDVGGGEGVFISAAARRAPQLRLMLVDLPAVAARARERLLAQGLAARAEAIPGDFLNRPLPRGADLATLVRVVHDHDDEPAMTLLRAVRAALPPGGTLLLAEPMAETPGAAPMGHAYFGFYLLAMGSGRPRSAAVLTAMLREAGFATVVPRRTAVPLQTGLLVARVAARA